MTVLKDFPRIGVVVVSFHSETFIAACLESLVATKYPALSIVVVENASTDGSLDAVRKWASGETVFVPGDDWPLGENKPVSKPVRFVEHAQDELATNSPKIGVTLVRSESNRGFAGGVNIGLKWLYDCPDIDYYWILNPDTVVAQQTPLAFAKRAETAGPFALIGGRILYMDRPDRIHTDGGRLHRVASTAVNVNFGMPADTAVYPNADSLDYISGASMFSSRLFVDKAGLLDESWFIFFEEIDWQLRRGSLPLILEKEAIVYHKAGATIGTGSGRRKSHPFSVYFTYRNMLRFARRWRPSKILFTYAMALAKLIRHLGLSWPHVSAALCGLHGYPPPKAVRRKLSEKTWDIILNR